MQAKQILDWYIYHLTNKDNYKDFHLVCFTLDVMIRDTEEAVFAINPNYI